MELRDCAERLHGDHSSLWGVASLERLAVGDALGRGHPEVLGVIGDKLTDGPLACLLRVILEPRLHPPVSWDALKHRRAQFRERLGMTDDGFEKWLRRNLTF